MTKVNKFTLYPESNLVPYFLVEGELAERSYGSIPGPVKKRLRRAMKAISAYGYYFREPNSPLEKESFVIDAVPAGEVVVEVAGCGLCHTDLSFFTGQVKPNHALPLILGHEISGRVVAARQGFEDMVGKSVIVPAVLPCGDCDFCAQGRGNACRRQKFPGNDFNGGFATHVLVPGRFLCPLPKDLGNLQLADLSVIADAVTTPYQALVRSDLRRGDLAIVIGVGGIGTYMVQWAKHAGAVVVAVDIDDKKLEHAGSMGADHALNARSLSPGDVKNAVRTMVKEKGLPKHAWKVFETSGTAAGQENAFALLSFAGRIVVVGFTMDKITIRLSNVMAFDADVIGNWACKPELYADVVREVLAGHIKIKENIEDHPLDSINEVFTMAMEHKLERRAVLIP